MNPFAVFYPRARYEYKVAKNRGKCEDTQIAVIGADYNFKLNCNATTL